MGTCIFCEIVAGRAPSFVVAADESTVAFLDRAPATRGHTLVFPRAHVADIWELSEVDAAATMVSATRVARLLEDRLSPEGLTLFQANRRAGWQDVFHFHLHVVPRWTDDGLTRPWATPNALDEQLAATVALLR